MNHMEIPLLRQSGTFVKRLRTAAASFEQPRYWLPRRINWSHRYAREFYLRERECFLAAPPAYIAGHVDHEPRLDDVFSRRLAMRQVLVVLAKVLSHWAFSLLGALQARGHATTRFVTYRKAYVDDIELVFDVDAPGVLRAVFPFPLGWRRQRRYLQYLRQTNKRFIFSGNPYLLGDLVAFLRRRSLRSFLRMEARAQLRLARRIVSGGFERVELSDEFDLGSLELSRYLRRKKLAVINSAHGIGKYLPCHYYAEFHVLARRQQEYYTACRPCDYRLRSLNDRSPAAAGRGDAGRIDLIFLSQVTPDPGGGIVRDNEKQAVAAIAKRFESSPRVSLHYKPHPNNLPAVAPRGFNLLENPDAVNGRRGAVFVSFYSTCQIDPSFKGCKILLRSAYIHPEIAFDEHEPIMTLSELLDAVAERSESAL